MLKQLEVPKLYQRTEHQFWTEEYISKQLLAAHLDPEFGGASRQVDFIEKSVAWIGELVPLAEYPSLLDLGCGPGLYAEKFANLGYKVTGVDFSERSINYARQSATDKGLKIDYHFADYLELDLHRTFDFITLIYCDYGALTDVEREILLDKITQHLKPGGKVLMDVFTMNHLKSFTTGLTWEMNEQGGFWKEEPHLTLSRNLNYGEGISLEQTTVITDEDTTTYNIWNTCFTKEGIIKELTNSGFKVVEFFGDVAGKPSSEDSETIALILEKA